MLSNVAVDLARDRKEKRARLRDLIARESALKGGTYLLASGRTSDIYFEMKRTTFDPEGSNLIADLVLDLLENEKIDYIGGIEMGAVPVVLAVTVKSYPNRPIKSFFVRKTVKEHGTQDLIDGKHPEPGSTVVVFDDVTTTGGSVLKAVRAVRDLGCTVAKVITIVDRQEGAAENLRREGVALVPLFTRKDFETA